MCGILGTIPASDEEIFKKALNKIYHRGPDRGFIKHMSNNISLGFRRLSIIDLSDNAMQPMSDESGNFYVLFNGEIYNFIEIRNELIKKGYKFKSTSDTEVILYSYIEWGKDCLNKFNGMWAFAIWDNIKKELFLSRDRFGKKPLFYAYLNGKFIFASEMKAILPFLNEIKPSKDFQWCKKNIFLYESTDKTLIEGIKRFPQAHYAILREGKLNFYRYWNTLDNLIVPPSSYEKQVEMFKEIFYDAVKIRMRSDVKVGTALSGGLDSSSVLATMWYVANKKNIGYGKNDWQHAFTAIFPDSYIDESEYAKYLTNHLRINNIPIVIEPTKLWKDIEKYLYMFEELYITPPIPMMALYNSINKHGIKVSIDGHGADELLSGYGYIVEALWDTKFNINKTIDILTTYQGTFEGIENYVPICSKPVVYMKYMFKKILKKILKREIKSIDYNHKNYKSLDNLSKHLYICFHETILPTLLRNYDRYSMSNSVEIRMPFMDWRLVRYLFSLPYDAKVGNGFTKKILRDAMKSLLPEKILYRKSKIGFNAPMTQWIQNDLRDWFIDLIHSRDFIECELIDDYKKIQRNVIKIIKKEENSFLAGEKVWTDIMPYLWKKALLNTKNIYE